MKAFDPNYKLLDEMYQDDYYPNCPHRFLNGRCVNCYWDGSKSEYIKHLEED